MLRVCLGGSLLLNATLASVWNDTRYEHTLASKPTIDKVTDLLERLDENKYLSAYKALVEIDDPAFKNLQCDYIEYCTSFEGGEHGRTGEELSVFHHSLSTRRTCYAFLLRNGAYGKYLAYQADDAFNYIHSTVCLN
jgi:hypothetical protein